MMLLGDLAEFTHFVTRVKIVPSVADDVSLTEAERTRGRTFATKLSMRVLARTWQMLLKGMEEVAAAGRPLAAAEMVLVRIAYAADLPTPDEVIRSLGDSAHGNGAAPIPAGTAPPRSETSTSSQTGRADVPRASVRAVTPSAPIRGGAATAPAERPADVPIAQAATSIDVRSLQSFEALVALATEKRDLTLKSALERDVRLVRFEDGRLEFSLEPSAQKSLTGELSRKLAEWTGRRWMVIVSAEQGMPSLYTQAQTAKAELKDSVRADPLVQAVLTRFPGAEIVGVRPPAGALDHLTEDGTPDPTRDDEL